MRSTSRSWIVLAVVVLLVLGGVGSALAGGKGGGASKGSLTLVVLDPTTAAATSGPPHQGGQITFVVSTTATDSPFVNVRCYQGEAFVYDAWAGFFEGAWFGQVFTLESPSWTGGAADCNARLVMWSSNGRERTLATTSFPVEA